MSSAEEAVQAADEVVAAAMAFKELVRQHEAECHRASFFAARMSLNEAVERVQEARPPSEAVPFSEGRITRMLDKATQLGIHPAAVPEWILLTADERRTVIDRHRPPEGGSPEEVIRYHESKPRT